MVDMGNAIDFRLGHCNGEFHEKIEKSKNGLLLPTWKLFNFSGNGRGGRGIMCTSQSLY